MVVDLETKVLGRYMIAPPEGTVAPATLPLTFFDLFVLPTQALRYLFFYRVSDHECHAATNFSDHFREHHLAHLMHSLSLALQNFYPLAGTIVTPLDSTSTPYISYSDGDSVELTVMESSDDITELAAHDPKDSSRFNPLIPWLATSSPGSTQSQSIMALQVTLFPEHRGVSIGLYSNHGAADGSSVTQFFKTWAALCKRSMLQETTAAIHANGTGRTALPIRAHATGAADASVLAAINHIPLHDRGAIKDPEGLKDIFWADINHFKSTNLTVGHPDDYSPPGVLRATFVLTPSIIDGLRSKAAPPPPGTTRYSSLTMALALAWVCSVKARGRLDEPSKYLGFPADLRKRLQHPVPATYFGNCIAYGIVEAPTEKLVGESGLAVAAAAIFATVRNLDGGGALEGAKDWIKTLFTTEFPEAVVVTGSPRFGMYEADFGWGRPLKVEMVNWEASGSLSVAESGNGGVGGIQLGLAFDAPVMAKFLHHFHAMVGPSG